MTYQFRTLFQVKFPHEYYDSGLVEDLEVVPSDSALKTMSGQNFLFRSELGGFVVLARLHQDTTGESTTISVAEETSLAFYLRPQSETFFQVTQLPTRKGTLLYANNRTAEDWELLPYKASSWSYDLTSALQQAGFGFSTFLRTLEAGGGIFVESYCLKDPTGEIVWQSQEGSILRKLDLNCSGLAEGCYSLLITVGSKQTLPEYRFIYSDAIDWNPTLAMYQWFAQSSSARLNKKIAMNQSYQRSFENVQSLWRYYIVPSENKDSASLSLVCDKVNGVDTDFGIGLPAKTPEGRDAVIFTSKKNIPLKQSPTGGVNIRMTHGGELFPLPYASSGYEEYQKLTKSYAISNIYVYL